MKTDTEKLNEIKEFLLVRRNLDKASMEEEAIEEDGYFDAESYSGGKFDDCFELGKGIGEAKLVESLLYLLES